MLESATNGTGWFSVLEIFLLNLLLSGDNAVLIALACRRLAPAERRRGMLCGVTGAIAVQLCLVIFAVQLLALPFFRLAGATALAWIGIRLLKPESAADDTGLARNDGMWAAAKTITVAYALMSMDNVLAIAAVFRGDYAIVALGVAASVPIVVWASDLVLGIMERFPPVILAGAAMVGWVAGTLALTDKVLAAHVLQLPGWLTWGCAPASALGVVWIGSWLARRGGRTHG